MPLGTAREELNKLAKWRLILCGWQLGTRSNDDPEAQAVRDQRELLLIMRAELNTITRLLIEKKVFSNIEHDHALAEEADLLSNDMEQRFPGAEATDVGIKIDAARAASWMSKFPK